MLISDSEVEGSKHGDVQNEILERKIKGLEKENKELNQRIQGIINSCCLNICALL